MVTLLVTLVFMVFFIWRLEGAAGGLLHLLWGTPSRHVTLCTYRDVPYPLCDVHYWVCKRRGRCLVFVTLFTLCFSHLSVWPQGAREYVAGSTLKLLEKRGVQYIHTTFLCDWDALTPAAPALDPSFCGPAIYGIDVKGVRLNLLPSSNAYAIFQLHSVCTAARHV